MEHKKTPQTKFLAEGVFNIIQLCNVNVDCLITTVTSSNIKCYILSVFQRLKAVSCNSGKMYENVLAICLICDKSETFLRVKPFYCTFIH